MLHSVSASGETATPEAQLIGAHADSTSTGRATHQEHAFGAHAVIRNAACTAIVTAHLDGIAGQYGPNSTYWHPDSQAVGVDILPILIRHQSSTLNFRKYSIAMLPSGSTVETAQCPIGLSMCDGLYSPTTRYKNHCRQYADPDEHDSPRMFLNSL